MRPRAPAKLCMLFMPAIVQVPAPAAQRPGYPETKRVAQVDDYHGTAVADPYRWLEDVDAPDTRAWIDAENAVTFAYLATVPERDAIRRRLTAVWDYPRYGTPFKKRGAYFFYKNDGLQNQSVLYHQASRGAPPQVLLDPNMLSPDGTIAVSGVSVSEDGRHLAYATSVSGSDWNEIRVRDIASGRDLADHIRWVKFSDISWSHDNAGFFYSRYPAPENDNPLLAVNRFHRLYYHRLGTEQSGDQLVYQRLEHPDWGVSGRVTEDGRYLVLSLWLGTDRRNRVYIVDLQDPLHPDLMATPLRLLDDCDAHYSFVANDGPLFYFRTDLDAQRGRVIAIDLGHPERTAWRQVIAQSPDVLENVVLVHRTFVATYLHDAHSRVALFRMDGHAAGEIPLPSLGTAAELSAESAADSELFFSFTSYLAPTTIFRHDFESGGTDVFQAPHLDFDAARFVTEQVFYTSKDGTRIPMFLTHARDLVRDGSNPTYLYGYGGFDISLTPAFSPGVLVWLEMGGVFAVPSLRGGGEYGEAWHEAGMHEKKQNVFDDFIAAAEFLIRERYTSSPKLAIGGGSNGGLLVGAVMTQRPELFGAALPAVGVMDMLRFHQFTIGWAWVTEYGSADSAEQFRYLYAYSPLHRLQRGTAYPATLVTTADHDDRVVPGHSFKFIAALQAAQTGDRPVLIRVETKAGHGAGKPTLKLIDEAADRWAFLVRVLDIHPAFP
ncbi:MAG TPA: prolyl oligopeptidase family serine peptidase [Gemmatimonadales bacterium]|nr:prolyl oligopeptidase family serine peptidase [Gemmatimonadales bacterium]